MPCEHCKNRQVTHNLVVDNAAGAAGITYDIHFDICGGAAGCAVTDFCPCECHTPIRADQGVGQ